MPPISAFFHFQPVLPTPYSYTFLQLYTTFVYLHSYSSTDSSTTTPTPNTICLAYLNLPRVVVLLSLLPFIFCNTTLYLLTFTISNTLVLT